MGEIHTVWSYNGNIFFKHSVNDDAILVEHIEDVAYYMEERFINDLENG